MRKPGQSIKKQFTTDPFTLTLGQLDLVLLLGQIYAP